MLDHLAKPTFRSRNVHIAAGTEQSEGRMDTVASIFKIVDQRIKFYSQNTNLLPLKPKSTFRHLKQGIQDFHRKYVLVPADKAANNVVVV